MDIRLGIISGAVFAGVLVASALGSRADAFPDVGQGAVVSTVGDLLHLGGDDDEPEDVQNRSEATVMPEATATGGSEVAESGNGDDQAAAEREQDDDHEAHEREQDDDHEASEHGGGEREHDDDD